MTVSAWLAMVNQLSGRELKKYFKTFQVTANCPLGCTNVSVTLNAKTAGWADHVGLHPASTRCFWSRQQIKDQMGEVEIDLHVTPVEKAAV